MNFEIGKTYTDAFTSWAGNIKTSITITDRTATHVFYRAVSTINDVPRCDSEKIRKSPIETWPNGTESTIVNLGRSKIRVCAGVVR